MSTGHGILKPALTPPTGAPVFLVEPRDLTVRLGEDVELRCQATGEPVPTIEWLRAGRPLQADRRLRTLPDGSLWLGRVEAGDAGAYECVAHNLLGSATAQALLAVRGKEGPCLGISHTPLPGNLAVLGHLASSHTLHLDTPRPHAKGRIK